MELILHYKKLELKFPFTISRWTYTDRPALVVELKSGEHSGYGEATHNPYYLNTEIEFMTNKLKSLSLEISKACGLPPKDFWKELSQYLEDCPFALCALDVAYYDWYTKNKGVPLLNYWNLSPDKQPQNCFTLSIDPIDIMVDRMQKTPWDIYKIKLGTNQDIEIVEALRQHTNATFWVDANCAWTVLETIEKSKALAQLGVEFIEQPLPADQWEAMDEVAAKSLLPIFADESCKTFEDIKKCRGRFHGINIKVMKCGGLTPALKMIEEARANNLKVMVGCMTESTIGISAIAHLGPLIDYADMDGQHFIKNDLADGVKVTNGRIIFPERNGTGVVLK